MNTIQASELRIGNFIGMNLEEYPNNFFTSLEIGETMKVYDGLITLKGAAIKRVETSFMYVDDFEPIPLNEDWLVRFGFENVDDEIDYSEFVLNYVTIEGNGSDKQEPFHFVLGVDYRERKTEIKYVHQLQNLYWCLCGEELKINL